MKYLFAFFEAFFEIISTVNIQNNINVLSDFQATSLGLLGLVIIFIICNIVNNSLNHFIESKRMRILIGISFSVLLISYTQLSEPGNALILTFFLCFIVKIAGVVILGIKISDDIMLGVALLSGIAAGALIVILVNNNIISYFIFEGIFTACYLLAIYFAVIDYKDIKIIGLAIVSIVIYSMFFFDKTVVNYVTQNMTAFSKSLISIMFEYTIIVFVPIGFVGHKLYLRRN